MSQDKLTQEKIAEGFTYSPITSYTPITYEQLAGNLPNEVIQVVPPAVDNLPQPEPVKFSDINQASYTAPAGMNIARTRDENYDLMRRAGALLKLIDSKSAHRDLAYLETIVPDPKLRRARLVKDLLALWQSGLSGQELTELGAKLGYSREQVNNLSIFLWNYQKDLDEAYAEKPQTNLFLAICGGIVLYAVLGIFFGIKNGADASYYEFLVFTIFALAYGAPYLGLWLGKKAIKSFLQYKKDILWPRGLFPFEDPGFDNRFNRRTYKIVSAINRAIAKITKELEVRVNSRHKSPAGNHQDE